MDTFTEDAIKFAKRFSDAAPEKFKEVAFHSALQHFLSANNEDQQQKPRKGKKKAAKTLILKSEDTLNEILRINKTVNAIGMSLMKVLGKYADRVKRGNEFCYKLTSTGEEHLAKMIEKLGD